MQCYGIAGGYLCAGLELALPVGRSGISLCFLCMAQVKTEIAPAVK